MLAALAAIGILLPASRAAAAKIDITPSISLDQVYDSNVFNTDGNEKGDFIFRVTPAVTFSLKMPETTLNLRTSLTSDTYYKYTELNSTNSAITLALDSQPPLASHAQVFDRAVRAFRPGAQLLPSDPTGAHGGPAGPALDRLGIGHAEEPGLRGGASGELPPHGENGILPRRGFQQAPVSRQHHRGMSVPG